MEKLIYQLYYGGFVPAEHYKPCLQEHKKLKQDQNMEVQDFYKKLDEVDSSLKKPFGRILDSQHEVLSFDIANIFTDGFKMGARLMMEIMSQDDGQ